MAASAGCAPAGHATARQFDLGDRAPDTGAQLLAAHIDERTSKGVRLP